MAITGIATNDALTVKKWEKKTWRETIFKTFFFKRGLGYVLYESKELMGDKNPGDTVTLPFTAKLTGNRLGFTDTVTGNEEQMNFYNNSVSIEEVTNAVKYKNPANKRVAFSISEEVANALSDWMANELDQMCVDALAVSPTKTFYGGSATSKATLGATDYLTTSIIEEAVLYMKQGNRKASPIMPGISWEGQEDAYMLICPSNVIYDLRVNDTTYKNSLFYSLPRSPQHPFFTGATTWWGGAWIHQNDRCEIGANAGAAANIKYARCYLIGKNALTVAWAMPQKFVPDESDYKRINGMSIQAWLALGKSVYNSRDYSCVEILVATSK